MLLTFIVTSLTIPSAYQAGEQTVRVEGIPASKGKLTVCLWSAADGFPDCSKGKPVRKMEIMPRSPAASVTFQNVPKGNYAVSVALDRNGNGRIDKNLIGIPTEPIGVSGARPKLGPPKYRDSTFVSSAAPIVVRLGR